MSDLYDALRERGCIHPVLFRAMVQSQIGEECPFPTIKAAADHYGLHPEHLRMFIRGIRPAEPKLLAAFGLERVTLYAPRDSGSGPKGGDGTAPGEAPQSGRSDSAGIAHTTPSENINGK